MTKICELINFHTAYGNQVRLKAHYYDEYSNRDRLTGYMPIRSHRSAFLTLAKAQLPDISNKDKVFMLTGSFGTGKSHLCLMLANYYARKSSDPEMETFFEHWAARDSNTAHQVMNMRSGGRYLVAICEFGENKYFEEMIYSAIEFALTRDGAEDVLLESRFKGALDQIEQWEKRKRNGEPSGLFDDFVRFLGGEDRAIELERLKHQLKENSTKAFNRFNNAYETSAGVSFNANVNGLNDTIKDLLSSQAFSRRYEGLVILADEFGYALSEGKVQMSVFQSFAEMSKEGIHGKPIIFVGTGHRRFESYGANTPAQIDFRVVSDRVTEVSLQSEELEQIIAALVSPKYELEIWEELTNNWLMAKMANETKKENARGIKFFDYLSEPEVLEQIVQNIYPMHPASVYCLTRMSQELGSDARSVFSFFRQKKTEGGYLWFVDENDVYAKNDIPNFYTPDLLVKYFKQEIRSSNTSVRPEIRDYIRNYLNALDVAEKKAQRETITGEIPPLDKQVLDLIFTYQVSDVPITAQNLLFGMNFYTPPERKKLEDVLQNLKTAKIIFLSPTTNEFEFRRTNMVDYESMITVIKNSLGDRVIDTVGELTDIAKSRWEDFLLASEHNTPFFGDKRMKRIFVTPNQLNHPSGIGSSEISYWSLLEKTRCKEKNWKNQYDGIMVYVICETEDEVSYAQQLVKGNNENTIIVGVPRNPIPVKSALIDYLAVKEFIDSEDYQNLGIQEKALVEELLGSENSNTGYIGLVIKKREEYLSGESLIWYQKDGKTLIAESHTEHEPADAILNQRMVKRNRISHPLFNLAHPKRFNSTKDTPLRDAVSAIISYDRPITIDSNEPESQGQIRYLKNVLVRSSVLVQTGDFDGTSAVYELTDNLDRFKSELPALYDFIKILRKLEHGETLEIWSTLDSFKGAPYGLGPYAIAIFLAVVIRYMGDDLRLKLNPTQLGYSPVYDPEIVLNLANGEYPYATVERLKITAETIRLIDSIYQLFSGNPGNVGAHNSLRESWSVLRNWWRHLTSLKRTVGLYDEHQTAQQLASFLTENQEKQGISTALIEKIKEAYGYNSDAELDEHQTSTLISELKTDKNILESYADGIKARIVREISQKFTPEGDTYQDYSDAIRDWVNNLHPDQKNRYANWCTDATNSLIDSFTTMTDINKTLLEVIPSAPGFDFGNMDSWGYDRTEEFLERFSIVFDKIQNALPKVAPPIWKVSPKATKVNHDSFAVKYNGESVLNVTAASGTSARISQDQDPTVAIQYDEINNESEWEHTIKNNCEIFIVSVDKEGNFSRILRFRFQNLDEEYKLIPDTQGKLIPKERTYKFRNPTNKEALVVMLKDVAQKIKQDGFISLGNIKEAFKEAENSLDN